MKKNNNSIAILGAGITGLSVAYALQKRGINITIYEKGPRAGGVVQTQRDNDWLVEKGPNTLLVSDQRIWDLLDELQLNDDVLKPGEEAKKRYVIRDKQLHAVPLSLIDFIKTDLLSTTAKFRLFKEPFIAGNADDRESVAGFIRRRLGHEVLDYAVNPFVSGIYAGDPKQLSVKHTFSSLFTMEQEYGSIAKGFLKQKKSSRSAGRALISFKKGLHQLPQALANKLDDSLLLRCQVDQIKKIATGWVVKFKNGSSTIENRHRAIISTIPAHQLPKIWNDEKSQQSVDQLADIKYVPMSALALGFRRNQIHHALDGFGMLIPEKEPFSMLGCLFSSSLFVQRAPKDHVLLTCFFGGARNPDIAAAPTELLIKEVLPQLDSLLKVSGPPVFHHHTFWEQAIPQYNVGYDHYLKSMKQVEKTNPGFFLAGNFRGGVSVPDCILNGLDTANKFVKYLDSSMKSSL